MGKATEPTKASSTRMANADEQARPKKKARIEAGQCLYDPGTPLTKPGAWEDPPESKHGDRERSHPGAGVNRMDHRVGFFKKQRPLGKPEDRLT